jgi:hypothetical protein
MIVLPLLGLLCFINLFLRLLLSLGPNPLFDLISNDFVFFLIELLKHFLNLLLLVHVIVNTSRTMVVFVIIWKSRSFYRMKKVVKNMIVKILAKISSISLSFSWSLYIRSPVTSIFYVLLNAASFILGF